MSIVDLIVVLGKLALFFLDKNNTAKIKEDQFDEQIKTDMGHALLTGDRTAVVQCLDRMRNQKNATGN